MRTFIKLGNNRWINMANVIHVTRSHSPIDHEFNAIFRFWTVQREYPYSYHTKDPVEAHNIEEDLEQFLGAHPF